MFSIFSCNFSIFLDKLISFNFINLLLFFLQFAIYGVLIVVVNLPEEDAKKEKQNKGVQIVQCDAKIYLYFRKYKNALKLVM